MAIDVSEQQAAERIQSALLDNERPEHAALARLRDRLTADTEREKGAITSYDRMHHRHNRS